MSELPSPEQDVKDEEKFLADKRVPVNVGIDYRFEVAEKPLRAPNGKSVTVVETRPTKLLKLNAKREPISETDFAPRYFYEPAPGVAKRVVVIHFTAGGFRGSLGALVGDGQHTKKSNVVGVPFMIGRSGKIYELHPDECWGYNSDRNKADQGTVAIELVNVGPLIKNGDDFYKVGSKGSQGGWYCPAADEAQYVDTLDVPFRGYRHFARHTDEQYTSLRKLLQYLMAKYAIDANFIGDTTRDPTNARFKRLDKPLASDWSGFATHVNFKKDPENGPYSKWDIGPAFDWDKLTAQDMSLPVPISAIGGSAAPAKTAGETVDAKTVADELRITRKSLDRFYDHTEKDTASKGGSYPVGVNTLWHGGVHLFVNDVDVHACLPGHVVAARLKTPALEDGQKPAHYGSAAFVLVRHELEAGMLDQLDRLRVPERYVVKKTGDSKPGIAFSPAAGFADPEFMFEPGDVLVRDDVEDERLPTSDKGTSYPVRIAKLADTVEIVRGFEVIAIKKTKVKPGEPVDDEAREPKLAVTHPPNVSTFHLDIGDQVTLVEKAGQKDLRRRVLGKKKKQTFEVVLSDLGDEVSQVQTYTVDAMYSMAFRANQNDPTDEAEPSKDEDRNLDLAKGDILTVLDVDPDAEGEVEGLRHVKVEKLGDVKEEPDSLVLTKAGVRPLLASLPSDEKTAGGDKPAPDVVVKLVAGDTIAFVQRRARVVGASGGKGGRGYDLVKITALAAEPKVPQRGATATAKKSAPLAESATAKAKKAGKGSKPATLQRLEKVVITDPTMFPLVGVTGPSGSGYVDAKSLDLELVPRNEANWVTEVVDKELFVVAYADAELKAAKKRTRELTVGTTGYIAVPSSDFAPDGKKRKERHHAKTQSGKDLHRGNIVYDPRYWKPLGETRQAIHARLVGETGDRLEDLTGADGKKGKLAFDPAEAGELRAVRKPIARLAGKSFYSLTMHVDDAQKIDAETLKKYRWLPREIAEVKLQQPTKWHAADGSVIDLAPGDVLRPDKPWRSDQVLSAQAPVVWKEIAEGDIVTELVVKETKNAVWLTSSSAKDRVALLQPGDRLTLRTPCAGFKGASEVEVTVVSPRAYRQRGPATAKKGAKPIQVLGDTGAVKFVITATDPVIEMGVKGARSAVLHKGKSGWVATKLLGADSGVAEGAPLVGKVVFKAADFSTVAGKRTAGLARHKGTSGLVDNAPALLKPAFAAPTEQPATDVKERLERGEVIVFRVPHEGAPSSNKVAAGDPLWKSGTYGPVLPRDKPEGRFGKLVHWEIFSDECLLPARPYRPEANDYWKKAAWPWWQVEDPDGDWTMNCKEILELVGNGVVETKEEEDREKLVGEILNPKEIESLYTQKDVAEKLRHASCRFILEWAVDARAGLRKMKDAHLDASFWGKLKQTFQQGDIQDWSQHVDGEWADRQAKYFRPMLWWDQAVSSRDAGGSLPAGKHVWHYNPIAFLEAFNATALAKEAAKK